MRLTSYTVERTFSAAPSRLFRAITEPEDLAAWVWGPLARQVEAEVHLVPGGEFRFTATMCGAGPAPERVGMRGLYVEIEAPRRLVHTLHWDASVGYNESGKDPVDEVVVIEIEPEGRGSRLSYTHLGIPDDGVSAREHEQGVCSTLDLLERRLAAAP